MGRFLSSAARRRCLLSAPFNILRLFPTPQLHGVLRSLETLAYEEIRVSERPVNSTAFVLHGLLGSTRNWRTFSRSLASELQKTSPSNEWRMVLADLRNHGRSSGIRGLDPPHDMANAARDLANLVKSHEWEWPDVVIGHSMGGKVALDFAASCALGNYGENAVLPKQLWVLDSVPGKVGSDESDGEVEKVLQTLSSLPSALPSPNWLVDHMIEHGFSKSLSEWIGSNLKKSGDGLTWTFDLQAAIAMFDSYRETSYWHLLEKPPSGMEIVMVRAENSDRWPKHVLDKLFYLSTKVRKADEGKLTVHLLPKSGHWVHVDNPKGLLEIMVPNFMMKF
ncbi:protein ABHD11 [Dendrobium catenatum]|uniref:Protein phosphatase methylesterase 1 n=1 Tax=Dendrobium catenatum TaxID=906689 RepID=A0A2I0VL13_9ASPA|nr:protein ABHD11 [Dendrobium catenatum]PKU64097.1 protein phosphatase methylesterase 1 [Dendrobium catenatum]